MTSEQTSADLELFGESFPFALPQMQEAVEKGNHSLAKEALRSVCPLVRQVTRAVKQAAFWPSTASTFRYTSSIARRYSASTLQKAYSAGRRILSLLAA